MKTAMQELIEKLKELRDLHPISGNFQERISRAKYVFAITEAEKFLEKEKQQIIDAYIEGYSAPENRGDSELYYASKYTTNKETLK